MRSLTADIVRTPTKEPAAHGTYVRPLRGRIAVVTGASATYGLAIVRILTEYAGLDGVDDASVEHVVQDVMAKGGFERS